MKKQEILDRINEIIIDEKGKALKITDLFTDSELDSLGTMIVLITIDSEFSIFDGIPKDQELESLNLPKLTMRDLVLKCKLSIINTTTEQTVEKDSLQSQNLTD